MDKKAMGKIVMNFFQELFNTGETHIIEHILSEVENCKSDEANVMLTANFSEEEIWLALKGMGPTKALGDDGFSTLFFQQFWHIVGFEITSYWLQILNKHNELESLNITNIILFFINKVIVKVIANQFQHVLEIYIDSTQFAFVPEQLISNNILVAYEIMHTLQQKEGGKERLYGS